MAYHPLHRALSLRPHTYAVAASVLVALGSSAHEVHADPPAATPPERPTFRLQYRLLDGFSQENCPTESATRSMFNRVFRYEVIDDNAGPSFAIDVSSSHKPAHFEAMSYLLRDDLQPIITGRQSRSSTSASSCFRAVHDAVLWLWTFGLSYSDQLKAPPEPAPETIPPVMRHALPDAEPAPAAPPPAPPAPVTVNLSTPVWKRAEGFMLMAGLTTSVGLMPTPSLGGLLGVSYRRGAWSGGLEGRVEHGLVSAYLHELPIDSLYAGAALVAPCVHEGAFSGCFVLDSGGYSLSLPKQSSSLVGNFAMLGLGLRANLEHRLGEHLLLRGFVQMSAMPVTPSVDWPVAMVHLWNAGPAFGTLGLTLISIP